MALTAGDLMTQSVVSVDPETPLGEVYRLFTGEQIHGAPVVDEQERVVGVITSSDLLRSIAEERDTAVTGSDYLRDLLEFSGPDWGQGLQDFQDRLAQLTVADVMTPQAVTVSRATPIAQVARTLREHGIHRAWVEEGGRLCGVISTFDLLPLVEKSA
ncbi:MAG: CBS domain-containing protein [Myxococcota bacterium]